MSTSARRKPASRPAASPGRPKDPSKRAAILEAAKSLFLEHGYEGVSMDQIASQAGVSKLTVYSHFGDKDALFAESARSYCEQQMPTSIFNPSPDTPLRERLLEIAHAFFAMITAPEALAGHRLLCTPQMVEKRLARLFWQGGPQRVQDAFAALLARRVAVGQLEVDEPARAAGQFFALLKGDLHQMMVLDCCDDVSACQDFQRRHIESAVDMFLRAYTPRDHAAAAPPT